MPPSVSCRSGRGASAPKEQLSQVITRKQKHFPLKSGSKLNSNQIGNKYLTTLQNVTSVHSEPHKKSSSPALESHLLVFFYFMIPKIIS